jgi:ankyrin repeat protein
VQKNKKKGKQTDEDFDEMLAELRAADLTIPTVSSTSNTVATASQMPTSEAPEENTFSEKTIFDAVHSGNLGKLRRLALRGVRVQSVRPLYLAAMDGKLRILQCLVEELGADVNQAKEDGSTALCVAAQNGHVTVVRYLGDLGVNVNQARNDRVTPLHMAAQFGRLAVVQCLVGDFGADVNRGRFDGGTPLYSAAMMMHLDVVRCLVEVFGADVNQGTDTGITPLSVAAEKGNLEMVRCLGKGGADANQARSNGGSPLYMAVASGNFDIVRCLVKNFGANVNQGVDRGKSAVNLAAEKNNLSMMRFLVMELGADINLQTKEGYTPLEIAAQMDFVDMVRCMVKELGADIINRGADGMTALHHAAQHGSLGVVRCLVKECGVDINQASHSGVTPLMFASVRRSVIDSSQASDTEGTLMRAATARKPEEVAHWLLKNGADSMLRDRKYGTAVDVAKAFGASTEYTAYLKVRSHCANPFCDGAGLKKCAGCSEVYFCGAACIKAHWPAHKAECKRIAAVKSGKGKSTSSSSGL